MRQFMLIHHPTVCVAIHIFCVCVFTTSVLPFPECSASLVPDLLRVLWFTSGNDEKCFNTYNTSRMIGAFLAIKAGLERNTLNCRCLSQTWPQGKTYMDL